jgi:hypothetical protein
VRRQCALDGTESHITSTTALYRSGKPRLGKLQRLEPSSLPVHPWSGYGSALRSDGAQIASRGLSGPAIGDNLEKRSKGNAIPSIARRSAGGAATRWRLARGELIVACPASRREEMLR